MEKKNKIALCVNAVFAYLIVFSSTLYMTRHFFEVDFLQSPYILKTISSLLFVFCGLFNLIFCLKNKVSKNQKFMIFLFIGLFFAMLGDIFLIDFFVVGAILFAVGHVFFLVAFCTLSKFKYQDFIFTGCVLAFAFLIIFLYPKFEFDGMLPVAIGYALIISCMLGKAGGNLFSKEERSLNLIVFIGALMFFLSDLMLLFNVFANAPYLFDVLCLVLYYPGEFVLAFSIFFSEISCKKEIARENIIEKEK